MLRVVENLIGRRVRGLIDCCCYKLADIILFNLEAMGTDLSHIACNYYKEISFPLGSTGLLRAVENLTDGGVNGMIECLLLHVSRYHTL
jgi:hypothetical protein